MYCRNCGKPVADTDNFCPSCGAAKDDISIETPEQIIMRDKSYMRCLVVTILITISMFVPLHIAVIVYRGFNFEGLPISAIGYWIDMGNLRRTAHIGAILIALSFVWSVCVTRFIMFFYSLVKKYERIINYGTKAVNWLIIYTGSICGLTLLSLLLEEIMGRRIRRGNLNDFNLMPLIGISVHLVTIILLFVAIILKACSLRKLSRVVRTAYDRKQFTEVSSNATTNNFDKYSNCNHEFDNSITTHPKCGHDKSDAWICVHCDMSNDSSQTQCKYSGREKEQLVQSDATHL